MRQMKARVAILTSDKITSEMSKEAYFSQMYRTHWDRLHAGPKHLSEAI